MRLMTMVATAEPMSVPRVNEPERIALERASARRPLTATVRELLVCKHGERPANGMLRMLLRVGGE
jgi:hypothetical protein